jgi:alkanesulfonate monooxygenase SsuD/methylene tetrahydromethanopterin reductase-like flavin-dependent oxidoreductase (luciferase family)
MIEHRSQEREHAMDIGIGLDHRLGLSFAESREIVREAAQLGYSSAWTPAGTAHDSLHTCVQWSEATREITPGGLTTGISVVPVPIWTAPSLAASAGTVGELTGGRFVLGIGSGSIHNEGYRRTFGLPAHPPIAMMRDWLIVLRQLLSGEKADHDGKTLALHGPSLGFRPPRTPVYLGALGEQMLRLAGELADGAALNWSTPEQVAWSRRKIAEGAARAGRDPSEIKVHEYIRICVDEDEDLARRGLAQAVAGYALARPGASKQMGYRAHFARMGFDEALTELEERRDRGASEAEIADAFPVELLRLVGYYGRPDGAAAAFRRLAEGLDVAVVRVVQARPGVEAVRAVMRACRPELVNA